MRLHADLSKRAIVHPSTLTWQKSPANGVDRLMLDRIGAEVARATTVVRFHPYAKFPHHVHGGGEEYFVLEGTFHDQSGAHGPGHYVRNPINTAHEPWTEHDGCVALVKLRQMHESDTEQFSIDTTSLTNNREASPIPLVASSHTAQWQLYHNPSTGEEVYYEVWEPGAADVPVAKGSSKGGEELFVIEGSLEYQGQQYPRWSFLRFPPTDTAGERRTFSTTNGCKVFRKAGHLLREIKLQEAGEL